MGLNDTPSSERMHIGFFGRRNAGKSSIVNAVTGQELSVVSDVKGTTTDAVYKAMELLPAGPVVIIDTPGYDDNGNLGEKRVKKTMQALTKCDLAVLVIDGREGPSDIDSELKEIFKEREIQYIIVYNKSDVSEKKYTDGINVSAATGENINTLKEKITDAVNSGIKDKKIIGDLLNKGDTVILVIPIDTAAPKGRIILPQQQVIRDILDAGACALTVKEDSISAAIKNLKLKPAAVVTDSQVFKKASADTPREIPLTSFSILMARYKGYLETAVRGISFAEKLKDGDTVLICEGCTHHRQCDDIGTVKIPRWLKQYSNVKLNLEFTSGRDFPENLDGISLIIHCGGCMLNEREIQYRMKSAVAAGVPFTNYGVAIAYMQGILKRSLEIFPNIRALLD